MTYRYVVQNTQLLDIQSEMKQDPLFKYINAVKWHENASLIYLRLWLMSADIKGCHRACDSLWIFTLGADNELVWFLRAGTLIKSGKKPMDTILKSRYIFLKSGHRKAILFLVSSKRAYLLFPTEKTISMSEKFQSLSMYSCKKEI